MANQTTGTPQDPQAAKYLRHPGDNEALPTAADQQEAEKTLTSQRSGKKVNPNELAHAEADQDIAADADLSIHSPNDDLDEGELARLGEDFPV